jgi:hypothetical protein
MANDDLRRFSPIHHHDQFHKSNDNLRKVIPEKIFIFETWDV